MPNARYIDAAITALHGVINAGLVTQLRAVEADQSLTANTIPNPVEILNYYAPERKIAPSVQVYETRGTFEHSLARQRNRFMSCEAEIAVMYNIGLDGSYGVNLRRTITAIIELIEDNNTLSSVVSKTLINSVEVGQIFGTTENEARRVAVVNVLMDVYTR